MSAALPGARRDMGPISRSPRVGDIVVDLVRHPWTRLIRTWNWKSAILSSVTRASVFGAVNLTAGRDAAILAMTTEFVFRATTSGFYGALTQAFRLAQPTWTASLTVMLVLPLCTHSLEFLVHWWRQTPQLVSSLIVSAVWTAFSTLFNLYAMRRGVLVVGSGRGTLLDDVRAMPRLITAFATDGIRLMRSAATRDTAKGRLTRTTLGSSALEGPQLP